MGLFVSKRNDKDLASFINQQRMRVREKERENLIYF